MNGATTTLDYATPARREPRPKRDLAIAAAAALIVVECAARFFGAVAEIVFDVGRVERAVENASLAPPLAVGLLAAQVAAIVGRSPRLSAIVSLASAALAGLAAVLLVVVLREIIFGPPEVWTTPSRRVEAGVLCASAVAAGFVARANDRRATRLRRELEGGPLE